LTETDFWLHLEYRVSRTLGRMPVARERGLWCDGISPGDFHLSDSQPRITGHAWIVHGQKRWDEWRFTLILPTRFGSRDEIDWSSLLPPDDTTGWLSVDESVRHIGIDPAATVPDLG
jgi:hypothetical protein